MPLLMSLLSYLLLSALLAVPVLLAAKIVRMPYVGMTFCTLGVAASLLAAKGLARLLPQPRVHLPLAIVAAVLLLSICLGTTVTRALAVVALQVPFYLLLAGLWLAAGAALPSPDVVMSWFTP